MTVFFCAVALLALAACWANSLAMAVQIALTATLSIWAWFSYQQLFAIKRLQLKKNASWLLTASKQPPVAAKLLPSTTVFSMLVFLHFEVANKKQRLILAPDSFKNPADNRQLRLLLNVSGNTLLQ